MHTSLSILLRLTALSFLLTSPLFAQDPPDQTPPSGQDEPWNPWRDPKLPRGAQDGRPAGGVNNQEMWPAPTDQDWEKPVQITFQRTWKDAVAVAREENKAILVCVNMDGEPASENYAGCRYRDPEIAKLYEPYVCVIASVYRHTPRDYDVNGERILCPRFGSVTCGEHIYIEPILFEKFLDGTRVAPRHIMVELDGSEVYDIYYAWDTDSVFSTLEEGIDRRQIEPRTIVRGDRPILERVASRHIEDRQAVEKAYREGDEQLRQRLLAAAAENPDAAPIELLRLAIYGLDSDLAKRAREALAGSESEHATGLILEALRVPLGPEEHETLVAALERLGEKSPQAKTMAVVQRGLGDTKGTVDVEGWSSRLAGATYQPATEALANAEAFALSTQVTETQPEDALAQLESSQASLDYALDPAASVNLSDDPALAEQMRQAMLEDALEAAENAKQLGAAEQLGEQAWQVDAGIALPKYYLGEKEAAYALAEKAVTAMPAGETSWQAMAVLGLFAEGRRRAIEEARDAKKEWPKQWLTDVHTTYSILAKHPLGTDGQVVAHYDFLNRLGAAGKASEVLQEGLGRFPASSQLHDRLRGRIIADQGLGGLETVYDRMLQRESAAPEVEWYAGLAMMVTAEFQRRRREPDAAIESYAKAAKHYERFIEKKPDARDSAEHYLALILAGRARIALGQRDLEQATDLLIASFDKKPEAAATLDGLNVSPADTSRVLQARLRRAERDDLVKRLDEALTKLDPALLELPDYERDGPQRGGRRRGR
ncbi:MAG: hypothetical protein RL885_32585 [Planctomycetota bacterium]